MACPREGKQCDEYMCGNMIDGICGGKPKESDTELRAIVLKAFEWQRRMDVIDCDGCDYQDECVERDMNCYDLMTEKFFEQLKENKNE